MWELVFHIYCLGPRDCSQVVKNGSKHTYSWNHLSGSTLLSFDPIYRYLYFRIVISTLICHLIVTTSNTC